MKGLRGHGGLQGMPGPNVSHDDCSDPPSIHPSIPHDLISYPEIAHIPKFVSPPFHLQKPYSHVT